MATLRHSATGRLHRLGAHDLVGRSPNCQLTLRDAHISGEHAAFRWSGDGWELRDLSSRNGTFVGGQRMDAGQRVQIKPGDALSFGTPRDPWEVQDILPPVAAAYSGSERRFADEGLLVLPGDDNPEVIISLDSDGAWTAERGAEVSALVNGQSVEAGGAAWVLALPTIWSTTRLVSNERRSEDLHLLFKVSRDEEHIELEASFGEAVVHMDNRAHSYLLLTLARERIEAAQDPALPLAEHGWVYQDTLSDSLGMPGPQFNMAVFRARQQFREAGLPGADVVIERRRGSGQIRLGVANLEIVKA
jgi:hypothetical protein